MTKTIGRKMHGGRHRTEWNRIASPLAYQLYRARDPCVGKSLEVRDGAGKCPDRCASQRDERCIARAPLVGSGKCCDLLLRIFGRQRDDALIAVTLLKMTAFL